MLQVLLVYSSIKVRCLLQVSICVITYNRPLGLRRLLEGIRQLQFTRIPQPTIETIVVDNDNKGLAKEICTEFSDRLPGKLVCGVEPQRGISYARNKAVSLASPESDFIAIIDDDEVPTPYWLEELLLTQAQHSADVVAGRVVSRMPDQTPDWIVRGGFFRHKSRPTGTLRHVAYTNNVLVKGEVIRSLDRVFDLRFALTGGEDSELFSRLHRLGHKIVWCNEAVVEEWVSPTRLNLKYILTRGYRSRSTYSLLEQELNSAFSSRIVRMLKGVTLVFIGLMQLILALPQGKHKIANSLLSVYHGFGTCAGVLKIANYQLYKKSFAVAE